MTSGIQTITMIHRSFLSIKSKVHRRLFSLKQNNFWLCGQAFASFQHGLFMSEEMLDFIILYTWKVYQKMLIYNFVFGQKQYNVVDWHIICLGRCYCLLIVADVIATLFIFVFRLMLLSVGCGRCYCHFIASLSVLMADGIAKMSLVFCNHQCWYIVWQMLLPSGRWNSHFRL